jgi:hypothetical protein
VEGLVLVVRPAHGYTILRAALHSIERITKEFIEDTMPTISQRSLGWWWVIVNAVILSDGLTGILSVISSSTNSSFRDAIFSVVLESVVSLLGIAAGLTLILQKRLGLWLLFPVAFVYLLYGALFFLFGAMEEEPLAFSFVLLIMCMLSVVSVYVILKRDLKGSSKDGT